jgi:glutamine amidotransferase PdxT
MPLSFRGEVSHFLISSHRVQTLMDFLWIESTTMVIVARVTGLLEPLQNFVQRKPVWGTCAGAILLSQCAEGTKKGGQDLLGGISITIARNGWGSQVCDLKFLVIRRLIWLLFRQVESFEADLITNGLSKSDQPFTGFFIRAPVGFCILYFASLIIYHPLQGCLSVDTVT